MGLSLSLVMVEKLQKDRNMKKKIEIICLIKKKKKRLFSYEIQNQSNFEMFLWYLKRMAIFPLLFIVWKSYVKLDHFIWGDIYNIMIMDCGLMGQYVSPSTLPTLLSLKIDDFLIFPLAFIYIILPISHFHLYIFSFFFF